MNDARLSRRACGGGSRVFTTTTQRERDTEKEESPAPGLEPEGSMPRTHASRVLGADAQFRPKMHAERGFRCAWTGGGGDNDNGRPRACSRRASARKRAAYAEGSACDNDTGR